MPRAFTRGRCKCAVDAEACSGRVGVIPSTVERPYAGIVGFAVRKIWNGIILWCTMNRTNKLVALENCCKRKVMVQKI